ncbi:GntR family transcriptional regulator YhfZ [Clostridium hydrogeniformans]|uniref:GntR family transcriptional regulator YhfZ n=1 Tax=Clostridium hydrogeniformans TaxID=349933 RepID=UPI00055296A2|nr:GntR family transcriptional regulator YhfZ [Clostridium hydrogeniformans]
MTIRQQLMQKNGLMAMNLAKEFLTLEIGDRISTVAKFSEKYSSARGTVQVALKILQDIDCIRLDPRGHLGTYITYIDYVKLLEVADISNIVGVMPLPYSRIYEGLATGIYNSKFSQKFALNLAYMRGASNRIKMLKDGRYDFVVMSKLAAEHHIKEYNDVEIAVDFGNMSFVKEHILIFNSKEAKHIEDGMKVGIDYSSIDHKILTLNQCEGKRVEFKPVLYSQLLNNILKGEIDAAVWNIDDIKDNNIGVNYKSIDNDIFKYKDTEAVIVVDNKRPEIGKLLKQFINVEEVLNVQNSVVQGRLIPNY